MRLERLRQMTLGELALRSRQEASKWLDRMAYAEPAPARPAPSPTAGGADVGLSSFFEGANDDAAAELVSARLPEARDALLGKASALLEGRFDLLGHHGLSFGEPIDWRLDPVSGRRAPRLHWSRIDPLDVEQVGDSKVVWELGRMQWLVTLGQAYRLTGAAPCAARFASTVRDFIRANPPGLGIHWTSSLECALRIIAWSWALALFRGAPSLTPDLTAEIVESIDEHARHVERYLSTAFSPNTHLTGEALGLVYAGLILPWAAPARRWLTRGLAILVEESERQILPDGIYFEQATAYQRYTAEIGLHLLILARRSDLAVPEPVAVRLQRLLDALVALRRPDGTLPLIGDADGGWLLPLAPRAADDARGVFAVAAVLFGRPDYAWAAGGLAPEVAWMFGSAGVAAFDALDPAPPAASASRHFKDGGCAVMASGWNRDAHQLVFDVGPLGCPVSGAHGHADLLSIQCSAFGEPFVVDPGTYVYTGSPKWRNFFRSTAAHATVVVDGVGQADPTGPFGWRDRPAARLRHWLSTGTFDFADALHDAYLRLPDPVVHRRRILFVKPRYWIVVDDLAGAAEHRVELRLPFAPLPVTLDPWPWVRARGRSGRGLLARVFGPSPLAVAIHEGETEPIEGWVSADYGRREPAPTVVHTAVARLPLRILTLLVPIANAADAPPDVVPIPGDAAGPEGLAFEGGDRVRFADGRVVIDLFQESREEVA